MKSFNNYTEAERAMIEEVLVKPQFVTSSTFERFGMGFLLKNPLNNKNNRSNYEYADKFFEWLISGEKEISQELLTLNPWVARFVSNVDLPENFSSSYGWKIREQIEDVMKEIIQHRESRRGYLNILQNDDHIIRTAKTTHEYPCTIGLHFFIRTNELHLMVNMRSNNLVKVMPYDVYNFTTLQRYYAEWNNLNVGWYFHQINSAHVFKGDARRWLELYPVQGQY